VELQQAILNDLLLYHIMPHDRYVDLITEAESIKEDLEKTKSSGEKGK